MGRPPGKPPGLPPAYESDAHEPPTVGDTATDVAVIAPVESMLPVAVTQLPTVMSERPPALVLLIGVELLKATSTFPLVVPRISVVPWTLTSVPPVRSPARNPVEGRPAGAPAVPQATMAKPSAATDGPRRA